MGGDFSPITLPKTQDNERKANKNTYKRVCNQTVNQTERRIKVIKALKEELKEPFGYTHLYFCSPVYVHSDYNKWRAIEIKGNENFCEKIINIAKSKYPQFYGKN